MRLQTILHFSVVSSILEANQVASTCRCLYGQSCWPNQNDFDTLNAQLSRSIIFPLPPQSACYPPSAPSGNCSAVISNANNGNWRSDQPGGMEYPNYETFIFKNNTISACYLDTKLGIPCGQGSVPPVGVDARSSNDVQVAVNFARRHNLKLVVKNTGHDYLGRSIARGGFMIWTHNMKEMSHDATFVPEGGPAITDNTFDAVTLGAGVQWREAYEFVDKQGRAIVGGMSSGGSVGAAGGWVMGGGHSVLAPKFGLGVDNVLQFTIVLANGSLITTNAFQHSDLFWALRGGGGGTYGVVTSTTYQTHPIFPSVGAFLKANLTSPDIAQKVATEFIKFDLKMSDAGWGGDFTLSNSSFTAIIIAPNISLADVNATFLPFVEFISEATGGLVENTTVSFGSFYEFYCHPFSHTNIPVGYPIQITSRLLPRNLAVSDPAKAAKILLSIHALMPISVNSVAGGAVSRVDPHSTGLNPSWRKALSEVYTGVYWPEGSTADHISHQIDHLRESTLILDELTTDSGSYYNEASLHELDFKKSFFGSHYDRLKSIKDKYDPTSLLVVPLGVGSDEWDAQLVCKRQRSSPSPPIHLHGFPQPQKPLETLEN